MDFTKIFRSNVEGTGGRSSDIDLVIAEAKVQEEMEELNARLEASYEASQLAKDKYYKAIQEQAPDHIIERCHVDFQEAEDTFEELTDLIRDKRDSNSLHKNGDQLRKKYAAITGKQVPADKVITSRDIYIAEKEMEKRMKNVGRERQLLKQLKDKKRERYAPTIPDFEFKQQKEEVTQALNENTSVITTVENE